MDKKTFTRVCQLQADRDTALKLAEQMELKSKQAQVQAEQMLEEGYNEAYEMIAELRSKIEKQEREIARLLNIIAELKAKGTTDDSAVPSPAY